MVDCGGLENRWPVTGPGGSNPSLSAEKQNGIISLKRCETNKANKGTRLSTLFFIYCLTSSIKTEPIS